MMKKQIIIATAFFALASVTPVQAAEPVAIAIVDSGFDSSIFSGNVIQEVCVTAGGGCNNRTGFEIGPGSAGYKSALHSRHAEDWAHGNLMAQTIIAQNSDVKLVLIRNSKIYGTAMLPGTEKDLQVALKWVQDNASKYNIVGVSVSRGSHAYVSTNREVSRLIGNIKIYENLVSNIRKNNNAKMLAIFESKLVELKQQLEMLGTIPCPVNQLTSDLITQLQQSNVATIVATGNDADKRYVDYPACITASVSVTAHDGSQIAYVANQDINTDFATNARTTSEATAKLAGIWSKLYNGSYNSTYDLIANSGTRIHQTTLVP